MGSNDSKILLLLSGGIDSTALLNFYIENGKFVETVFIDYGQKAAKAERESSIKISNYYGVVHHVLDLNHNNDFSEDEIPFRNAFLIFSSLMYTGFSQGVISMGIHDWTGYADCSKEFQNAITEVLNCYTNGKIIFLAPFLDWEKKDIIEYCKNKSNIPINMTYSCERGGTVPCGECLSCRDRSRFNVM